MTKLLNKNENTIEKHINNIFKDEELFKQLVAFYSLDVIISVSYTVKNGFVFSWLCLK